MEQGFVMWLTGVPSSGKSTLAGEIERELRARGLRVENLDADEVRQNLSPDLKWSKEDRDMNTKRLTFMGKVLARNGVAVLIAAVASLREFRDRARREIPTFVEVYVKCPVEICRQRDPKGLYARGDRGEVNDIAGVHQPYEEPLTPEIVVDTGALSLAEGTALILRRLRELGYLDG